VKCLIVEQQRVPATNLSFCGANLWTREMGGRYSFRFSLARADGVLYGPDRVNFVIENR
jgi:hypothetical protein